MKRLIGIAVIFGMVTASVFAQVQVSGQIRAGGELVIIHSDEDTDPETARLGESARIDFRVGNDSAAGDVGGLVRLQANGGFSRAFVWWRPHDMVRLQFGQNSDGDWGMARFNGWSFLNGDAMDLGVARRTDFRFAHATGFYGGISAQSILLSLFPMDGLTVNFGLPLAGGPFSDERISRADDAWKRVHAQVVYDINNIGIVSLSYDGGRGNIGNVLDFNPEPGDLRPIPGDPGTEGSGVNWTWGRDDDDDDDLEWSANANFVEGGRLWLAFFSGSRFVSGLDLNIGVGFELPVEVDYLGTKVTYQDPMQIGLGVGYTMGDLNVRFRTGVFLLGSIKANGMDDINLPVGLGFNLLPNYAIGSMRVFVNLGLDIAIPDEGDTAIQWMVNPYVRIPVGGLQFFGGFSIEGWDNGNSDDGVMFRIPVGVVFSL